MKTQIILLRGVMPTGKNRVPMAQLRSALEDAGLCKVRTYIQSGNVVVSTDLGAQRLEALVHDLISSTFGGDITVFARDLPRFKNIVARNPFKDAPAAKLYFTLLAAAPEASLLQEFLKPGYSPDAIEVIDDVAYVLCATKYSDLKINNNFIERKLRLAATTRVSNTINKLIEIAEQ